MVMSRDALKATDHTRGTGEIRGSVPGELDSAEFETVCESMMNLSVVTIKLLMSPPNCGITANKRSSKGHSEEKRVITGNELCWYIPGFSAKQVTALLFALCVCPGPCRVPVLGVFTFGPYLGKGQVRFSKCDNNRN